MSDPVPAEGLPTMLDVLIRQNLERDPDRRRLLERPLRAVIEVPDADVCAVLDVDGAGGYRVTGGDDPDAPVRVHADGLEVLRLASVPLLGGLPDVRTREGRSVLRGLTTGRIRVRGIVVHLGEVRRLTSLLSAR